MNTFNAGGPSAPPSVPSGRAGAIVISSSSDGENALVDKGKAAAVVGRAPVGRVVRKRPLRKLPRCFPPMGATVQIIFSDSSEEEAKKEEGPKVDGSGLIDELASQFSQLGVKETKQLAANFVSVEVQTDISIPPKFVMHPSDLRKVVGRPTTSDKVPSRQASKSRSSTKAPIFRNVKKQIFGHPYEDCKWWNPSPLPSSGSPSPCKDVGVMGKEDGIVSTDAAKGLLKDPMPTMCKELFGAHVYEDQPSVESVEGTDLGCTSTSFTPAPTLKVIENEGLTMSGKVCGVTLSTQAPAYNTRSKKLQTSDEK